MYCWAGSVNDKTSRQSGFKRTEKTSSEFSALSAFSTLQNTQTIPLFLDVCFPGVHKPGGLWSEWKPAWSTGYKVHWCTSDSKFKIGKFLKWNQPQYWQYTTLAPPSACIQHQYVERELTRTTIDFIYDTLPFTKELADFNIREPRKKLPQFSKFIFLLLNF